MLCFDCSFSASNEALIQSINNNQLVVSSNYSPLHLFTSSFPFFELVLKAVHLLPFVRVFTIKLVHILLVLLGAIILLASASGVVDFAPGSLAMGIGKGGSSGKEKPLGYPVLKGPYDH